jgi:hypothetical protein
MGVGYSAWWYPENAILCRRDGWHYQTRLHIFSDYKARLLGQLSLSGSSGMPRLQGDLLVALLTSTILSTISSPQQRAAINYISI